MNTQSNRPEAVAEDLRRSDPGPLKPSSKVGRSLILKVNLCRGLFAFLVVFAHSYDVCWVLHPEAIQALPESIRHLLFFTVQSGYYWVMGFFVISGYCIQLSVGRLESQGKFPIYLYMMARLTRIFPLYYAGLVFALVVESLVAPIRPAYLPNGVNPIGWISQLFFVQRFFQTFGSFASSWTITNELFYYVLFGLLAAYASGRRGRPAWVGMGLCIAMGAAMQWLYASGIKNWFTLHIGLLFGLGTVWFMGALVAVHGPSLARHRAVRWLVRAWPLGLILAMVLWGQGRVPLQAIYLGLGLAFSAMLIRFQTVEISEAGSPPVHPGWLLKTAEVVGMASYPTYLFHGPVLLLIATAISKWGLISDWRVTWLVLVSSGIGVGIALGWLAERPIMAWRAGLLKRIKVASESRLVREPLAEA